MALFKSTQQPAKKIVCSSFAENISYYDRRCVSTTAAARQLDTNSDAYQYLEKSRLPSYHFQKGLMRLPIPKLEKTCERYLRGIKPIINDPNQYESTVKLVKEFEQSEGKYLHDELVKYDKANKHTSYISKPWFDVYLKARTPLPINFNPVMAFAADPDQQYNDQLTRATNLVLSIGRFKRSLDEHKLAPEVFHLNPKKSKTPRFEQVCRWVPPALAWYAAASLFKAFPLDMSQYTSVFNTTRVPQLNQDVLVRDPGQRHFIVMRRGHAFAVDLFDAKGNMLSPTAVHSALHHILHSPLDVNARPVGCFTAAPRDVWARHRQLVHAQNPDSLKMVDGALFVLCLDDQNTMEPEPLLRNLLCGNDAGANRWFDKSFSLIVDAAGVTAINFEHSWGDGVAMLRLLEEIKADSEANHFVSPQTQPVPDRAAETRRIDFEMTDHLAAQLTAVREQYQAFADTVDFANVQYFELNKDNVKKHKLSPDAVMQMAIQIAYYRLNEGRRRAATYESCSTAIYKHGRTEVMRPATAQTSELSARLLTMPASPDYQQLRQLLHDCSDAHYTLAKEASMGQGFDRHLLGLKVTAERLGLPVPKFYSDPSYQEATHFVLSTSTLSNESLVLGGFGAVVEDGYGFGYNVVSEKLGGVISTYRQKLRAQPFADAMYSALDDIKRILDNSQPPSKK